MPIAGYRSLTADSWHVEVTAAGEEQLNIRTLGSRVFVSVAGVVASGVLVSCAQAGTSPTINGPSGESVREGPYRVVRVVDGDTFTIKLGSQTTKVRVIGIDTPESVDPRRPVQCFGKEASARASALLSGKNVWLEVDPNQDTRDRFGRLLRFVWIDNTSDFGLTMIRDGFALEYTYDLPYRYQAQYRSAQVAAKETAAGLWSPSTCAGNTKRAA